MAAEDAAVDVRLVDHDVREARQHLRPAGVVREDPHVQHVRVREDRIAPLARERTPLARRVAVVQRRSQAEPQLGQPSRLILGERLRRAQVERARTLALEQLLHERQRVGQRLAAGRSRDHADVLAAARQGVRLGLMRVQLGDALGDQGRRDPRIDVLGQRRHLRRDRLVVPAMHELVAVRMLAEREQRIPGPRVADRDRHHRNLANVGSGASVLVVEQVHPALVGREWLEARGGAPCVERLGLADRARPEG